MCASKYKPPAMRCWRCKLAWLICATMALLLLTVGWWLLLSEPPVAVQSKPMPLNATQTEGMPSMPMLQTPRPSKGVMSNVEI